nr:hypothetical protein [Propionibacterium ruminifibrarum]
MSSLPWILEMTCSVAPLDWTAMIVVRKMANRPTSPETMVPRATMKMTHPVATIPTRPQQVSGFQKMNGRLLHLDVRPGSPEPRSSPAPLIARNMYSLLSGPEWSVLLSVNHVLRHLAGMPDIEPERDEIATEENALGEHQMPRPKNEQADHRSPAKTDENELLPPQGSPVRGPPHLRGTRHHPDPNTSPVIGLGIGTTLSIIGQDSRHRHRDREYEHNPSSSRNARHRIAPHPCYDLPTAPGNPTASGTVMVQPNITQAVTEILDFVFIPMFPHLPFRIWPCDTAV